MAILILVGILAMAGVLTAFYFYQKDQKEQEEERARQYAIAVSKAVDVETYYDGISVEGVALGGKTREEAAELVKPFQDPQAHRG